jgi:hypothetical protein
MEGTQLLTVAEAARMAERSTTTIRRWVAGGRLTRREGAPPARGGKRPTRVFAAELHALLIEEGAQPRETAKAHGAPMPDVPRPHTVQQDDNTAGEVERLRRELAMSEVRELRVRLEASQAEADGLRQRLEDATRRHRELDLLVADTRQERDDWRDRHDAREAELRVLRGEKGLPWWRKLIGVQPVHELPDSMIEVQ